MAKVLDDFDLQIRQGGRKYPWESWFDGRVWQLDQGEDFQCRPEIFRTTARGQAARMGLKLRASVSGESVRLQAFPRDPARALPV